MNRRGDRVLALALVLATSTAHAREVDQFSDRMFQLAHLSDASGVLDAHVDALLATIVAELNTRQPGTVHDRDAIVYDMFQGGRFEMFAQIRSPFESWVRDDAPVELFHVDDRGIYGGSVDYDDMGLAYYIEIAPVIRIGLELVGVDKLGHFLGQGWFYYREYRTRRERGASEDEALELVRKYGHEFEASYLGLTGTGVYSYADLAANWQGFVFYRALFGGADPYIVQTNGRYRLARVFHFSDYVTDAWDETENPSRPKSDRFFDKVAREVRAHACADYQAAPERFLNASGHTQDPREYVWDGATDRVFACKRRFTLAEICR